MPPTTPPAGRRGLYPMNDGWYDIDSNGVVTKIGGNAAPETILGNDASLNTHGPTTNTAETVLKTITVPAGTLSADSFLRVCGLVSCIGWGSTCRFRLRAGGIGGTQIFDYNSATSGGQEYKYWFEVRLSNKDAQNVNHGLYTVQAVGGLTCGALAPAVNFANEQNLVITATPGGGTNIIANAFYFYAGYVP